MRRRSLVLASVALLLAVAGAAWWWCCGDATPAIESVRADEVESEGRRAFALESAMAATTDAPLDASREPAPDLYDPKHYVVIPTRDLHLEVVDSLDRTPIEGVTFTPDKHEVAGLPPLGEARTGSDGRATFTLPTDRRLHLTMEAKGFTPEKLRVPEEPHGTPELPFVIELQRSASIHGRLFDTAGEPLNGASVWLNAATLNGNGSRQAGWTSIVTPPRSATSTSAGEPKNEFLFENVPSDLVFELTVTAGEDDEMQESMSFCLEPGERREIEWHFGLRSSLAGRVVDDSGEPVAGATLIARQIVSFGEPDGGEPTTDANGEFVLSSLSPGRQVFLVRSHDPHHADGTLACTLAAGESRSGVEVVLPRAAPLTVRVRVLDGSALTSATAIATSPLACITSSATANHDDGTASIPAVPLGDVDVDVVGRAGASTLTGRVRFVHDGEHECVVECTAMATLRGTVEFASGRPANTRMRLALIRRDHSEAFRSFRASVESQSSEFEFAAVRPGVYDVVAATADGEVGVVPSLVLANGEQREGVVVRVESGAVLRVVAPALEESPARTSRGDRDLEIRVRRDGAFVAATPFASVGNCELSVPPGKLAVELWSAGVRLASRDVTARAFAVARVRF